MIYSQFPCYEEHASVQEGVGEDAFTASVVLRCAWALRWYVMQDIIGYRRAWPHNSAIVAKSASCVPDETTYVQWGQTAAYVDALISVNYASPGDEEEDLITESLEPIAEFLLLDYKRFRWGAADGDPLTEGEAPGHLLKSLALVRQLHKVEPPLPTSLLDLIGTVNDADYTSTLLGLTFPQGTLLYQPPTMQRTIVINASQPGLQAKAWNITTKFAYKPEGWNKFWRPKTQEYTAMFFTDGEEYEPYPEGDFAAFLY